MKFYSEYYLSEVTSRFVNKIWVLDNNEKAIPNMNILPNGCFNIAIIVGEGATIKMKNNFYELTQNIYFCSQVTENVIVSVKSRTKVFVIQLHAWAFSFNSLINFSKFQDSVVESNSPLELLNGHIDYKSSSFLKDLISITEYYFMNIEINNSVYRIIEDICRKIQLKKGVLKLSDIYKDYSYSSKWIQVVFKKMTGLTPKKYADIIQFRLSVDEILSKKPDEKLTDISYKLGFSDQSHFIKNFRQHSKTIPSKFNSNDFILSWTN